MIVVALRVIAAGTIIGASFAGVATVLSPTGLPTITQLPQCSIAVDNTPCALGDNGTVITTRCAEEDGNTNGLPCTWIDPDTGDAYNVDSANYRHGAK